MSHYWSLVPASLLQGRCSHTQVAATRRPAVSRPTLGKTEFIAQDNGHLLPTIKKRDSALSGAFATGYENMPSTRWPEKTVKSGDPFAGTATMGYKGIETTYLRHAIGYPLVPPRH